MAITSSFLKANGVLTTLGDALDMLDHAKLKLVLTKGHRKGLY